MAPSRQATRQRCAACSLRRNRMFSNAAMGKGCAASHSSARWATHPYTPCRRLAVMHGKFAPVISHPALCYICTRIPTANACTPNAVPLSSPLGHMAWQF